MPSGTTLVTDAPAPSDDAAHLDSGDVVGFSIGQVMIGNRVLDVAVADSSELRRRGLMEVEDLGDLDGMVFVMDGVVRSAFTMRNTLIPLDVAFFGEDGALVDVLEMTPCTAEPCPDYRPAASYRYAVEVPLGGFAGLLGDEVFSIKR